MLPIILKPVNWFALQINGLVVSIWWGTLVVNGLRAPIFICDALRNLVPFVQFQKRKKHSWKSVTFRKVVGFSNFPKSNSSIKHLWWIFFSKLVSGWWPLTIFTKKLHCGSLTGLSTPLDSNSESGNFFVYLNSHFTNQNMVEILFLKYNIKLVPIPMWNIELSVKMTLKNILTKNITSCHQCSLN